MPKTTLPGRLIAATLPLFALLGCGSSHETGASPASPSKASASPAPLPTAEAPRPAAEPDSVRPEAAALEPRKAVATVNGAPILGAKVDSIYRMNKVMLEQRAGRALSEADDRALRAQSLQAVIAEELLFQAAVVKGLTVSSAEIETAITQIKQRTGSDEAYAKMLAASGLGESEVRAEVEHNLKTEAFRKSLISGKGVTESDAKKYYDANAPTGMFNVPERAHIQYILVRAGEKDPEPVRSDARKRAEEAAKRAGAGEDFAALAKQYSQDPSAARGGDVVIPRGVMFPKFEEAAFSPKAGQVSGVIEAPTGFYVLKAIEKKPASTQGFDEVKSELMLEMGRMMEQQVVNAAVEQLAGAAKIAILDRSFAPPSPPQGAQQAQTAPPAKN